jgi:phosphate-selective porin
MSCSRYFLCCLLTISLPVAAQPLLPETPAESTSITVDAVASTPLIFRNASGEEEQLADTQAVARRLRAEIKAISQSSLSAADKQEALQKAVDNNQHVFGPLAASRPKTPEEAVARLELMFYEQAIATAPDDVTLERALDNSPEHLELIETLHPILIAPRKYRSDIVVTREAEAAGVTPWWRDARVDTEALELSEVQESPDPPVKKDKGKAKEPVKVEFLADEAVTVEMHDDTTVLRDVAGDDGGLVLFDGLHVWIGGAVQIDSSSYKDLYSHLSDGESADDTDVRRGEVIVRSTLFDWGEVKAQYDLETNLWRDLYYRRVNEDESRTLTIGNQKESMGLDYLMGNKFGTALERSTVASAFGSFRGAGVRLNNWFNLDPEQQLLKFGGEKETYITTSIGLYTQDMENTTDTDIALTGRLTTGRDDQNGGMHIGGSFSLRQGDYSRIAPRAGIHQADRIPLAFFDADQQAVVALEAMITRGPLHAQAEFYYSDYRGGKVDGEGYGAYVQAGWFLTGEQRTYRPKWGLWAPLPQSDKSIFEIFARASYTYADAQQLKSNNVQVLTLGGNWYLRQFRASINGLYSVVDSDINEEDSGLVLIVRPQYLL